MLFGSRKLSVPGAVLLPRKQAGAINWPRCARCRRIVDAYGKENETPGHVEIWASCSGILQDPKTGQAVFGTYRKHPPMKGSILLLKGPGWSDQRFTDAVARMSFFAEDGGTREWRQDVSADGVGKRWGAG